MGVLHIFYLLIGRRCSPEESKQIKLKLEDIPEEDIYERVSLEGVCNDNNEPILKIDGYPVIGIGDIDYCCDWYVCQKFIGSWSSHDNQGKLNYMKWPKPHDARYTLIRGYDVSC